MPKKKTLSREQIFYIEGHPDADPAALAAEWGVPVELITAHLRPQPGISSPAPGVVVLDGGSSSRRDDFHKGYVPPDAGEGRWHTIR